MLVNLYDAEGNQIAVIESTEGVFPRKGEVVRVVTDNDTTDYKIELVRWTISEDDTSVQLMVEEQASATLWPEGAPANVTTLFKKHKGG